MDKHNIKSRVNYGRKITQKKEKLKKMIGVNNYKHRTSGSQNKNIIVIVIIPLN
jgi:hypothetical protein